MDKQELRKDTESDICQSIEERANEFVESLPQTIQRDIFLANFNGVIKSILKTYEGEVEEFFINLTQNTREQAIKILVQEHMYDRMTNELFDGAYVNDLYPSVHDDYVND